MNPKSVLFAAFALVLVAAGLPAQIYPPSQAFPPVGQSILIPFTGAPEDYVIPTTNPPALLRLTVKGGYGGRAYAGKDGLSSDCSSPGGRGAIVTATFAVGSGAGQLQPGGALRVLAGGQGKVAYRDVQSGGGGGGGGAGTGILYRPSAALDWEPLVIAGGGGGASQYTTSGVCHASAPGKDASLTSDGTSGNGKNPGSGGTDGNGGGYTDGAFGGGGLWTDAECWITSDGGCFPNLNHLIAGAGYPEGGAGGGAGHADAGSGDGEGDWGCGGGGAGKNGYGGGGGGGYSGGGAGGGKLAQTCGGGGGGSCFVASYALDDHRTLGGDAYDGHAAIWSIPVYDGEDCATAIEIPSLDDGPWSDTNFTVGHVSSSFLGCVPPGAPDVFYRYQNSSPCTQVLAVGGVNQGASHLVQAWGGGCVGATFLGCSQIGPANPPLQVSVAAGASVVLQVVPSLQPSQGGGFTLNVMATNTGADTDGDGVPDCVDNCPFFNPSQLDTDSDGVGDDCDICPLGDDAFDSDGDGVPDACDACPGGGDSEDSDGDGVPDDCDTCMGDDTLDNDGDGVPDDCDSCLEIGFSDCDDNQIGDACTEFEARFEGFPAPDSPKFYSLNKSPNATPLVELGKLRLSTQGGQQQTAAIVFEPVHSKPTANIDARFDFRMGPGTGFGGDGMSFVLMDAAQHDPDTLFGHLGLDDGALTIRFDTYSNQGDPSANFIEVKYDGVVLAQYQPGFLIEDQTWRRVSLFVTEAGKLTMSVSTDFPTQVEVPFSGLQIPGWQPRTWRYGIGSYSGADTNQVLVDNIYFADRSDFSDCDFNGIPDACGEGFLEFGDETGLAGAGGVMPRLTGIGGLCANDWTTLRLVDAPPAQLAWFVAGLQAASLPFKSGVMVPSPDVILSRMTDTQGAKSLALEWPSGAPSAWSMWIQVWCQDSEAVAGYSATPGLQLLTP